MKNLKFLIICLLVSVALLNCGIINSITNDISQYDMPQNTIIGKWKLVKTVSGRTAQGNIAHTYTTVDVILEFKDNDILTVQCLRQDERCAPYQDGDYSYRFYDYGNSWYDKKIEIGNASWWYRISEKELELTQGPVDGGSYIFERLNISELQQTNSVTDNDVCAKCANKAVLKVLTNEPAYLRRGCFEESDSFYIELVNKPNINHYLSTLMYLCGEVPEQFRIDGLRVLVSGNILSCVKWNPCHPSQPHIRIAPDNLFELETIKQ